MGKLGLAWEGAEQETSAGENKKKENETMQRVSKGQQPAALTGGKTAWKHSKGTPPSKKNALKKKKTGGGGQKNRGGSAWEQGLSC